MNGGASGTIVRVNRMPVSWRIFHWVNFLAVFAAVITGIYIGRPYYQAMIAEPAVRKFVMGWNRAIHLYAAIAIDVLCVVSFYLYFLSRFERPVRKLLPTKEHRREFFEVLANFLTFNRRKRFDSAELDAFNAVWFTLLHLLLLFQLFTGLQLYVDSLASGLSSVGRWWPWLIHVATDWTYWAFGGRMGVRWVHHFTMYLLLGWIALHVYYEIWRTVYWREGDIAIAFGGEKIARGRPGNAVQ